jgi:hypothetical protein
MKFTKEEARYVDPLLTDTGQPCVMCRSYNAIDIEAGACSLVEGLISPGAGCFHFAALRIADIERMMEEGTHAYAARFGRRGVRHR